MKGMMLANNNRLANQRLILETRAMYDSTHTQNYIQQEVNRPAKQWIMDILNGLQESEEIKLETDEFVLLPDTERVNRYHWKIQNINTKKEKNTGGISMIRQRPIWRWCTLQPCVNWLAIVKEPGLRSLRDLRGKHIPMLKRVLKKTHERITMETGIREDEIMAYIHYPPSVFQLHIHFAYPYAQHNHRDVYRIHSVQNVISNLEVDEGYYTKASIQLSLARSSPLYQQWNERIRSYSAVVQNCYGDFNQNQEGNQVFKTDNCERITLLED